jgi:Holliday junction resolvasome RuvABC endonuclease subunit
VKKQPEIVLGIDSSLRCTGFAFLKKDKGGIKLIRSGKIQPPEDLSYLEKCQYTFAALEEEASKQGGTFAVIIEQPNSFQNGNTTRLLCGLYQIIRFMFKLRFLVDAIEANTKAVKKAVFEDGNTDKETAVKLINDKYGLTLKFHKSNKDKSDDDIADAIAVAEFYFKNEEK